MKGNDKYSEKSTSVMILFQADSAILLAASPKWNSQHRLGFRDPALAG